MLDWWFDIDNRICSVRMDERKTASTAVFDGDFHVKFEQVRLLRSGMTYVYSLSGGHGININDVKFRGERYVSLYLDGTLIKEYNVNAEYCKRKYGARPESYERAGRHAGAIMAGSAAAAFLMVCFALSVATAMGFISTLKQAAATGAAVAATLFVLFFCVSLIRYLHILKRMEKYSVISSVKNRRKQNSRIKRKSVYAIKRKRDTSTK